MFVDFNKVFKNKPQTQITVPTALVEYMNKQLPKGVKYIVDENGNCVIKGDGEPYTIGGFIFRPTEEQKKMLGKEYSEDDIMKLFYNMQKPIPLVLKKDGYITINGEEFSVDKLVYNPYKPIRYEKGSFCMVPPAFPNAFSIIVGCEKYTREMMISRIPNESVDVAVFESEKEAPLYIKYYVDERKETFTINLSFNLKYAKTVRDIVESTMIYNAYMDGEGYLCGQPLKVALAGNDIKRFERKSAIFWEKVLRIEEALGVSFVPPQDDVDFESICIVEQLFQNLINKVPVRDKQIINSIDGSRDMEAKNEGIIKSLGKPIYFEFEATTKLELFEVKIDLPALLGIFNAVLSDYSIKGEKNTIILEDESPEKRRYTTIMCFKTEGELKKFKKGDYSQRIKLFHEAKAPHEYLE